MQRRHISVTIPVISYIKKRVTLEADRDDNYDITNDIVKIIEEVGKAFPTSAILIPKPSISSGYINSEICAIESIDKGVPVVAEVIIPTERISFEQDLAWSKADGGAVDSDGILYKWRPTRTAIFIENYLVSNSEPTVIRINHV